MPPRRLITTSVLPPVVPPKEACIIASPNICVTAMPPPSTPAVRSSERRDMEKSRQPQACSAVSSFVVVMAASARHVVGGVQQGHGQPREEPAGQRVLARHQGRGGDHCPGLRPGDGLVGSVGAGGRLPGAPATAGTGGPRRRRTAASAWAARPLVPGRSRPASATSRRPGSGACRSWRTGARPRTTPRSTSGGPSGRGQENSSLAPCSQLAALAQEFDVVGFFTSTARARAVATRSAYGVRTLRPSEVRKSGCWVRAVSTAEMSVSLLL